MNIKSVGSLTILSASLASCGNSAIQPAPVAVNTVVSTISDGLIVDDRIYKVKPVGYEEITATPGVKNQTFENLNGVAYQEVGVDTITAQEVVKVSDAWRQIGPWTKTVYGATERLCNRSVTFNISVTGSYSASVSAEGTINLVKLSGTVSGGVQLSAGSSYTVTACAYFQKQELQRYVRWELWAYYSDGSSKWTGGVSNIRSAAQPGDVKDVRVSAYSRG